MRISLVALPFFALAACGGPDEGTVETTDGTAEYSVDETGGDTQIRFTDNEGNETVLNTGTEVEASLPDGFSVYPGASVVSNTTMSGGNGNGALVSIQSDDKPAEVIAYYRQQAEAAGIDIQMEMQNGQATMIGGESEDGLFFSFNASPEAGGTAGVLMVGQQ